MVGVSVLVVEDEAGIRELIRLFLVQKGYEVYEARDGHEALELVSKKEPHIILLDIEMPGMDGFEVCKQIRLQTKTPILFLSSRKELADKLKGLDIGADDYITKPFDFNELEARIRTILRRDQWQQIEKPSETILTYDDLQIYVDRFELYQNGKKVNLLNKEFHLLVTMAKQPNRIWTAEQLYDKVWGYLAEGTMSSVKVHISNLRKKIEPDPSTPKYIQTVRGFGYKFVSE